MNRMEEYRALLGELEHTPAALAGSARRAEKRLARRRVTRRLGLPAGSLAAACAAFVLLVNLCTPFALACGRVPVLRDLAAAVAFSPSLRAAVENEYVQYLGLEQTDGEVTMGVEYLIVDQRQVHIFFTVDSQVYPKLTGSGRIQMADGEGAPVAWSMPGALDTPGELYQITTIFPQSDVPDTLVLEYEVTPAKSWQATAPAEEEPEPEEEAQPVASFAFTLTFDPRYTQQGEVLAVGQWVELSGQRLYVDSVELYPTATRLNLADDPANTAWLKRLDGWLENGAGERFGRYTGGLTASGGVDTPFTPTHWLESCYFTEHDELTLCLAGGEWLDKDMRWTAVDLTAVTAAPLPGGVSLVEAVREEDGVRLTLRAPEGEAGVFRQVLTGRYRAPDGTEEYLNGWSVTSAREQDEAGEWRDIPGYFHTEIVLPDYPWDSVELELLSSRTTALDTPVTVKIK